MTAGAFLGTSRGIKELWVPSFPFQFLACTSCHCQSGSDPYHHHNHNTRGIQYLRALTTGHCLYFSFFLIQILILIIPFSPINFLVMFFLFLRSHRQRYLKRLRSSSRQPHLDRLHTVFVPTHHPGQSMPQTSCSSGAGGEMVSISSILNSSVEHRHPVQ